MKVTFTTAKTSKIADALVVTIYGKALSASAKAIDNKTEGAISAALKTKSFDGDKGELMVLSALPKAGADHLILLGMGDVAEATELDFEAMGADVVKKLNALKAKKASVLIDAAKGQKIENIASDLAVGAQLGAYFFDDYKLSQAKSKKPSMVTLEFVLKAANEAKKSYSEKNKVVEGVYWTRDLVTMPGNDLYPDSFAKIVKKELSKVGVKVSVMTMAQMKKAGMGALVSVGKGSENEPKLVTMQYNGLPKSAKKTDQQPVAFVGKGITFDTGGISLKPGAGMWDMKFDMGGAGVVVGLMKALATRKAKVNVVATIALAENMPSSKASRPGDIVESLSGQTIEILNTDAEGRLVLADALWYTQEKFKPKFIVDLATLTGAVIVALGHEFGGVYSNDETLPEQIVAAGKVVGEPAWHMPMCKEWEKAVVSNIADIKNITVPTVGAGSATAACFLKRFIKDKTPWAHIDIAGVAWRSSAKPTTPKGATAWGVRLLDRFVADNYEI